MLNAAASPSLPLLQMCLSFYPLQIMGEGEKLKVSHSLLVTHLPRSKVMLPFIWNPKSLCSVPSLEGTLQMSPCSAAASSAQGSALLSTMVLFRSWHVKET